MFETGLIDTITVKKPADSARDTSGNIGQKYTTIIDEAQCRVEKEKSTQRDETGHLIVVNYRTVGVNYSGSDLTADCIAIVNSVQEEIQEVNPARGFGRDFKVIILKGRNG